MFSLSEISLHTQMKNSMLVFTSLETLLYLIKAKGKQHLASLFIEKTDLIKALIKSTLLEPK